MTSDCLNAIERKLLSGVLVGFLAALPTKYLTVPVASLATTLPLRVVPSLEAHRASPGVLQL